MKSKLKACFSLLLITSLVNGQNIYDYRSIPTSGWYYYYDNQFGSWTSWEMFNGNSWAPTNATIHYMDIEWKTNDVSNVAIRILNAKGRTVKTMTADNVSTQRIYLDGLPGGTYMVMLVKDSDRQVVKFVIQ